MTAILADGLVKEALGESRTLKQIIADVQATDVPRLLTIDGEAQIVCLSIATYQSLLDRIELLDSVTGLCQAELEFEHGEDRDAHEAFEELRQKLGVSR